jgi:hypothetical protein
MTPLFRAAFLAPIVLAAAARGDGLGSRRVGPARGDRCVFVPSSFR